MKYLGPNVRHEADDVQVRKLRDLDRRGLGLVDGEPELLSIGRDDLVVVGLREQRVDADADVYFAAEICGDPVDLLGLGHRLDVDQMHAPSERRPDVLGGLVGAVIDDVGRTDARAAG
jgi:hypothetical protein